MVHRLNLEKRVISLRVLGGTNLPGNRASRLQVETSDLRGGNVDVVGAGKIVVVGCPQKTKTVGKAFQDARTIDQPVLLGLCLQDREDQVLLAHARSPFDVQRLGEGSEFADLLLLEFLQVHVVVGLFLCHRLKCSSLFVLRKLGLCLHACESDLRGKPWNRISRQAGNGIGHRIRIRQRDSTGIFLSGQSSIPAIDHRERSPLTYCSCK